ncbi:hypothetical protein BDY17DRAFT_58658 [Neohortaea acidophila]|uniref:Uncharacterized protein n=1 Tax=Neohortaea acidophila TaxID=245834 RepID=A0A6A6PFN6_9PEZI|nr:uncharacterized protein BDY17DRAFT_58658 [Neohortaea acidophila]KAF2478755.1 hypothetical protein BDY17DRAFT_58658 [Neohortaea acidophila]
MRASFDLRLPSQPMVRSLVPTSPGQELQNHFFSPFILHATSTLLPHAVGLLSATLPCRASDRSDGSLHLFLLTVLVNPGQVPHRHQHSSVCRYRSRMHLKDSTEALGRCEGQQELLVLPSKTGTVSDIPGGEKAKSASPVNRSATSTPLRDRTNDWHLAHIKSTAPLPSFQKLPPSPTPQHPRFTANRPPVTFELPSLPDLPNIHPPPDPPQQKRIARTNRVGQTAYGDRPKDTPELPKGWSDQHDRAICYLDVRGYDLKDAITKMRGYFPELKGPLSTAMLDKRLRQLDQNPDVGYWGDAMRDVEDAVAAGSLAAGGVSPFGKGGPVAANMVGAGKGRENVVGERPKIKTTLSRSRLQPHAAAAKKLLGVG